MKGVLEVRRVWDRRVLVAERARLDHQVSLDNLVSGSLVPPVLRASLATLVTSPSTVR